jgi:putative phosphoesterase
MRLALISDLHANLIALEAVLADAARRGYDQLVCLGDVATLGPRAREVLDRLRGLGCPCVMGNHDAYLLDPTLARGEPPIVVASEAATRAELTDEDFAFIRGFHPTLPLDDVLLFHGTPRSHQEELLSTTPAERVDEMLAGARATVLAGGHTHLQMVRQHRGRLIVNCGSVGMPFREHAAGKEPVVLPHAEYAIVDVSRGQASVELLRIPLDRARLAGEARGWDNPLARSLAAQY